MHRNLLAKFDKDVVGAIHLFLFDIEKSIIQTVVIVELLQISNYTIPYCILKILFACH